MEHITYSQCLQAAQSILDTCAFTPTERHDYMEALINIARGLYNSDPTKETNVQSYDFDMFSKLMATKLMERPFHSWGQSGLEKLVNDCVVTIVPKGVLLNAIKDTEPKKDIPKSIYEMDREMKRLEQLLNLGFKKKDIGRDYEAELIPFVEGVKMIVPDSFISILCNESWDKMINGITDMYKRYGK